MKRFILIVFAAAAVCILCGCAGVSTANIETVRPFNINKYLGVWYEQARLPHSFEDGLINTKATYRWGRNGLIEVVNEGIIEKNGKRKVATGVAETIKGNESGDLKVSFFRPFYGSYRIIYLDEKYTRAIVTADTADYLWILSREQKMPQKELDMLVCLAAEFGFDTDSLIFPQK